MCWFISENRTAAETYVNHHSKLRHVKSRKIISSRKDNPFICNAILYYSLSKVLSFRWANVLYTPRMYVHPRWSVGVFCKITCKPHVEVLNSCLNTYYILLFTDSSFNSFEKYLLSLELRFKNFSGYALFRCDRLSDLLCSKHKSAEWLSVFQCTYRHTTYIEKNVK